MVVEVKSASSTRGLEDVPHRSPLSARYKTTFAYPTIKDRCPVILCKAIDHLHRERNVVGRELGEESREGVKKVVEELSKLRYEMQTNKPIVPLVDSLTCSKAWNAYLAAVGEREGTVAWFSSSWMLTECYMYRRIAQALALSTPALHSFDVFRQQKQEGFANSAPSMLSLASWLLATLRDVLAGDAKAEDIWNILLQVCLWGNKCDLSISAGSQKAASGDPVVGLAVLASKILANNSKPAWRTLEAKTGGSMVDIVMDNSGFELFTDLCLADFLITSGLASVVRMRIKNCPWFVSDTTPHDFTWTLDKLAASREPALAELGGRWLRHVEEARWTVHSDQFWTLPHTFNEMPQADPDLYSALAQADLIIFKGDLNYRKLVGDLNWETTVPLATAVQGFLPAPLLSLRTAKADVMVGLEAGKAEETAAIDKEWMVSGEWGVVQFAQP